MISKASLCVLPTHDQPSNQRILKNDQIASPPKRLQPGLEMLVQAYYYAEDTGRDYWDFAVEATDLCDVGFTRSDCRWLISKGWALHARETEPIAGQSRAFETAVGLVIETSTCLVLTPEGARQMRSLLSVRPDALGKVKASLQQPRWDRDRHELWLGTHLVKQYKLPSANQETLLMVFEEEQWPSRISDPLRPVGNIDPKRRLHDTIKNLNRNQKLRLIRFMGDGTGEGVRWETIGDRVR